MKTFRKLLLVLLAVAIFCGAALQGDAQEKKKGRKKAPRAPDPVGKMLAGIDLTAEQQAKVAELKNEYGPKLAAIQERRGEIMTPERRKAEKEAKKAAKDAGKKGKSAKAAVEESLGLSPAERERLAVIQKEEQQLRAKLMEQVRALLTPEQKAKLPEPAKKKKKAKKQDK